MTRYPDNGRTEVDFRGLI